MRLVLVDTIDQLPQLLPLHAWSAVMSTGLVLVDDARHPLREQLEAADVGVEVVPDDPRPDAADRSGGMSRADLLSGLSLAEKRRAGWVVDRVRDRGEVAMLLTDGSEAFVRTLGLEAARAGVEVEMVYLAVDRRGLGVRELVDVQRRLRAPDGCPWDREQTSASLVRYAVEEAYELSEAVASGDPDAVREELGDLLLQVVFHSQIAEEAGDFTLDDVAGGIVDKLVRRHPHVFADAVADTAADVEASWQDLKDAEKPERTGMFDGVVTAQPALGLAEHVQRRAARQGFDWADDVEALAAVHTAVDEVAEAVEPDEVAAELGDLLYAVVSLCRHHGVDADQALRAATARVRGRLEHIEATSDVALADLDRDAWLAAWSDAKARAAKTGDAKTGDAKTGDASIRRGDAGA